MPQNLKYTSKDLSHLGLVAGMCDELKIAETIDMLIPTEKSISHGTAVCAMILNGLGFVNQRLYLVPEFFKNKPLDRLLGPNITADKLNDDTLGRTLDALYENDISGLYSYIAINACQILGLNFRFAHLDGTSFHVDGDYNSKEPEKEGVIKLTKGYSRDHRPELNQCILNLIVESQASIPIYMSSASGNSTDKCEFRVIVQEHINRLQNVTHFEYLVADSALYTKETLETLDKTLFITRMPETLSIAKWLIKSVDISTMNVIDENCKYQEICGEYGGIKQRWITVYSEEAYNRDMKSLNKCTLEGTVKEQKQFEKLCTFSFACIKDAEKAYDKFKEKLKYIEIHNLKVIKQARYGKKGKPKKGAKPKKVDYFLRGQVASSLEKREEHVKGQGIFIIATNELDGNRLPAAQVIEGYKGQNKVEKGFRFLKNPEFLASALFLKKPERIMALLMIMTLCLMVYASLEYRIRNRLKEEGLTVMNQVKKPTDKPTARWIFYCFEGISVLFSETNTCIGVINIEDDNWLIIDLLGYRKYYE